jgi:hypothetical protein
MKCHECNYETKYNTCPCTWRNLPCDSVGYENSILDDFPIKISAFVLKSINEKPKSVLLTGESGAGKTHMSFAIARHLYYSGIIRDIGIVDDFIPSLPSSYEKWLNTNTLYDFLIIDELNDRHFTLLNKRIRSGKYTICSTNTPLDDLDDRFGWRLTKLHIEKYNINKNELNNNKEEEYQKWLNYTESTSFTNSMSSLDDELKEFEECDDDYPITQFSIVQDAGVTGIINN